MAYSAEAEDRRSETPVDDHNHALAALRYLVSRLDARRMARLAKEPGTASQTDPTTALTPGPPRWWQEMMREELWTRIG